MNRILLAAIALLPLVTFFSNTSWGQNIHDRTDGQRKEFLESESTVHRMVMVPMRDGVRLATRIYVPKKGNGKYPAIFWRTPYNHSELLPANDARPSAYLFFAEQAIKNGYAFVIQNERGKYFSEGQWEILGFPQTDGWDALDWIAKQKWSSGKVATVGCSSTAEWQMALAAKGHPAHAAAIPMAYGAGVGRMGEFYEQGNMYRGGVLQQSMIEWMFEYQNIQRPTFPKNLSQQDLIRLATYTDLEVPVPLPDWTKAHKHLPMSQMYEKYGAPKGEWNKMAALKPNDPYWYKGGLFHDSDPYHVPTLWVSSWYDLSTAPNIETFNYVRKKADPKVRDHQYMIIAPTIHCAVYRLTDPLIVGKRNMGNVDFGFQKIVWSFLDRYCKDAQNGFEKSQPKVQYFAMGENSWKTSDVWPPKGFDTVKLFLNSSSGANSLSGDGTLSVDPPKKKSAGQPFDQFVYDPANPVPSLGGNLWGSSAGAFDNRTIEKRDDVLVFSTKPFEEDTEVSGQIRINLFVSSDAKDTDFSVKLLDVLPDGTAFNLDETIQRARYREGFDKEVWMNKGEVYSLQVSPITTSNTFKKGHRLRIEVSSSNFPRFQRNLNLGTNNFTESKFVKATNRVFHTSEKASYILVPMKKKN